ncbi:MAG: gliding motility-associated ABC transporter substrate-binding protein GldG [Bacteroidia bacterium]|nr:gliding motility-associated ABC transporter substrate-binding protein GldG [Bacteroidia bacterium]MCZ2141687.1 gliding motility-associated ABC transporter substrate-binding protein GldG [Bacteroidia bacterium]
MKKRNFKIQAITELGLVIAILIVLNLILTSYFFRIDLTSEKRYSLSPNTIKLIKKVDDVMYVKVYLEGEFPAGFKRLRQSTKEMLDEFVAYSGGKLEYEFIDPFEGADLKKANDIIRELGDKGLQPTNVQIKKDDESTQKLIVPGAIFYYKGKEYPVNLLKAQFGQSPETVINESIELMEYELANVLRKSVATNAKQVAFIDDNGELDKWDVADASQELKQFYSVTRIPLALQTPESLGKNDALIIAKPTTAFTEYEKFLLDQFVMHGGKILWLLETQIADMDSLNKSPLFMTGSYELNLDDMLFKWGVRIHAGLVQDLQCNAIPILSTMRNGNPQQKLLPWMFFPVAAPPAQNAHIIVKGIDPVFFQFVSGLDTTANKDVKKTVLLYSSPYSRSVPAPVQVDLNLARVQPDPSMFNQGSIPIAVLLEGRFNSLFQYRPGARPNALPYKEFIENGKMIVVSDGDVIRNQRKQSTGEIFPLGYDRYTNQQFGNKRFILNCMDYLCDDSGIIEVRAKEIKLRLLDKGKLKSERTKWQLINMVAPLLLLVVFGGINKWYRNRKYAA